MIRSTDRPALTKADDLGPKATKHTNKLHFHFNYLFLYYPIEYMLFHICLFVEACTTPLHDNLAISEYINNLYTLITCILISLLEIILCDQCTISLEYD